MILKSCFRIYCLNITGEKKNMLSISKLLVSYKIETFTKEVHSKFEDYIIFRLLQITLKIGLWYLCQHV